MPVNFNDPVQREKHNARARAHRAQCKVIGVCVVCGDVCEKTRCEKCLIINRKHYQNNRTHRLEQARRYGFALKKEVMNAYGGVCKCCGERELKFLSIDHVDGGGNKHRRELKGALGQRFYKWLRKSGYPQEGFQVLCYNCNLSKGFYGRCPHQKEG